MCSRNFYLRYLRNSFCLHCSACERRVHSPVAGTRHALLIFKFSATPVPSQISEIGQEWKNQVQHKCAQDLRANFLIVSLFTTQARFDVMSHIPPIHPFPKLRQGDGHTHSKNSFSKENVRDASLGSDATRNQSTLCHVFLSARLNWAPPPAPLLWKGKRFLTDHALHTF